MKTISTTLLVLALFVSQNIFADTFEGILTMTVGAENESTGEELQFYVKDNKLSLPIQSGKVIMDAGTDDLYIVSEQNSGPMVIKLKMDLVNQLGGVAALTGSPTYGLQSNGEGNNITATTEKIEIDGFNCTKYLAEDDDYKSEVWVAENFPFDFSKFLSALSMGQKFGTTTNPFPIKGSSTSKKNGQITHYKFTVEKSAVPDDAFSYPEAASVMDLSMMLRNMLQTAEPDEIRKQLQQMMPK